MCKVRVFKNKAARKWAASESIEDRALWAAAEEIINGQVEADLGGCLYKKRLPRPGKGKSGGYRTLVGYRKGNSDRVVFLYGFPKSKRSNITDKEKAALSLAAESFINATDEQVARLIKDRNMFELEAPNE